MSKTLCKHKKSRRISIQQSLSIFPDASHICRKCGRVSDRKKKLCKPVKLLASK